MRLLLALFVLLTALLLALPASAQVRYAGVFDTNLNSVASSGGATYTVGFYSGFPTRAYFGRSLDGGLTWTDLTAGLPEAAQSVSTSSVAASGTTVLLHLPELPAVLISRDRGATWTEAANPGRNGTQYALSGPDRIVRYDLQSVQTSTDDGQTWSAPANLPNRERRELILADVKGSLFSGSLSGSSTRIASRSDDFGATWTPIPLPPVVGQASTFLYGAGDTLLLGDSGNDTLRISLDRGQTYRAVSMGGVPSASIWSVVVGAAGNWLAQTQRGFGTRVTYFTTDGGVTWSPISDAPVSARSHLRVANGAFPLVAATSDGFVMVSTGGADVSTDGDRWTRIGIGDPLLGAAPIASVFTIHRDTLHALGGRWSADAGRNWAQVDRPYQTYNATGGDILSVDSLLLAFLPADRGVILESPSGTDVWQVSPTRRSPVNNNRGLAEVVRVGDALIGRDGNTGVSQRFMYRSTDAGVTWERFGVRADGSSGGPGRIGRETNGPLTARGSRILAAGGGFSADGGAAWTDYGFDVSDTRLLGSVALTPGGSYWTNVSSMSRRLDGGNAETLHPNRAGRTKVRYVAEFGDAVVGIADDSLLVITDTQSEPTYYPLDLPFELTNARDDFTYPSASVRIGNELLVNFGQAGVWAIDMTAFGLVTSAESLAQPNALDLHARPNPANGYARLGFGLNTSATVDLSVYDLLGRRVAEIAAENLPAGAHERTLDTSRLAPGLYLVRLSVGGASVTRRLVVAR